MNDEFQTLFEKVIVLWPDNLPTSEKTLHGNGGASIPLLSSVHDEISKKIESISDNQLLIQMDWAIYTILHQTARVHDQIEPRKVDMEAVRNIFNRNLALDEKNSEE